ncbi:hypothetical protein [Ornithinimicrobium sediminis]|uniref:hypothetical protein n=1 Tax=Ornithinimicrobium sediminis TaxID=2904603 RepID=UPI001E493E4B|nr:hypothetical protein [Ornithinimicrobium sediminis]MCE0485472.1 hypothetical protein [Ornithinimicrobium sediminis]
MNTPHQAGKQGRGRYPLARQFPTPGPLITLAYRELDIALNSDDAHRKAIGDLSTLPRPWDPGSIEDPPMRTELWDWLEAVVDWVNTEHVWDPAYLVPPCWPAHPHLVHEIAVLADQRHTAGQDMDSDALEEWHRYALPAFFDRRRTRLRTACDSRHHDWPARPAHIRFQGAHDQRAQHYVADVDHHRRLLQPVDQTQRAPRLQVVDGHRVDLETGEIR